MRKIIVPLMLSLMSFQLFGQGIQDSVSMGPGYVNQSFYSLSDGESANVTNADWDVAFDVGAFGTSIRINAQAGVELYMYPHSDTSGWMSVDTNGMSAWKPLYNTDTSWVYGAFDVSYNPTDINDIGWGVYNPITHDVIGDSIFVIRTLSGQVQKLWIQNLSGGAYNFRHASLDNMMDMEHSVAKATYEDRSFAYFSFGTHSAIDREPHIDDWDITFTKYVTEIEPDVYYGVTGVLANRGVEVAEVRQVELSQATYDMGEFNSNISEIGYDWKEFDMGSFSYVVEDSLSFFVSDRSGNIWKLVFESFEGSSTGDLGFTRELVVASGLEDNTGVSSFGLYPNPAASGSQIHIVYETLSTAVFEMYDISGRLLKSRGGLPSGFNNFVLDLQDVSPGMYVVVLRSGDRSSTARMIVTQ